MSRRPNIVYILPFYDEDTDTHLFYNYELIREVAKQGNIFVIIEKCPKLSLGQIKKSLGVSNCYIQKFRFPPLRFLELFWRCFKLYVSGYRNFYVHYSYYGALASWLATWRFHRQVRMFYWNRGMPWLFKRGWLEEKIFRFILRHTILVTGPELLAKEYQKRYGIHEYRVLSNWVDVARFAPSLHKPKAQILRDLAQRDGVSRAIPQQRDMRVFAKFGAEASTELANKRVVLFVHHLSKRKGADLVPEIAKAFGDDVLFLMIGDGPEREALELGIKNYELSNVKLLGQIPNSEIPNYFYAADVFLMPSREEGSPHVILEAMASGTPFVSSDIGGVRELVPKELEGCLCKSEDVECFQKTIKTLLSDNALYDRARAACINHSKNFDISRGVTEFIRLFK